MSFVCQMCNSPQLDGSKPISVVVEKRNKIYPIRHDKKGEVVDKGGRGYETVKEIKACKLCGISVAPTTSNH